MKLSVWNLGRIKKATFDLRPLTVFAGPNNTNKSWSAYCCYALARCLSNHFSLYPYLYEASLSFQTPSHLAKLHRESTTRVSEYLLQDQKPVDAGADKPEQVSSRVFEFTRESLLGDLANLPESLEFSLGSGMIEQVLATGKGSMPSAEAKLTVPKKRFLKDGKVPFGRVEFAKQRGLLQVSLAGTRGVFWQRRIKSEGVEAQSSLHETCEHVITSTLFSLFNLAVAFPPERIILPTLIWTLRDWESQLPNFPLPVRDNASFLQALRFSPFYTGAPSPHPYPNFPTEVLSQAILKGKLEIASTGPETSEPFFTPTGGPVTKLGSAASFVRSLASLGLYLQYVAMPGDLIMIDEPEMNAHPEVQVRLAEMLALLASSGVCVILTTHSPYIIDHLRNLMVASNLPKEQQEQVRDKFKLGDTRAFIRAEDVAAYYFGEDGSPISILQEDVPSIDWSTFGNVSDYVLNLFADLLALGDGGASGDAA
jgi:hypothetical protein